MNIPLAVPQELHRDIVRGAKETRLSQADVMRQSIMIGLPRLLAALRQAHSAADTLPRLTGRDEGRTKRPLSASNRADGRGVREKASPGVSG